MAKTFSLVLNEARKNNNVNTQTLNPKLWNGTEIKSEVRQKINDLTRNFMKELGLSRKDIDGIQLVGSNASYTWSPDSDLDVTLLVSPDSEMSRKRFKMLSKLTSMLNYELSPSVKSIPVNYFLQMRGLNSPIRNQSVYNLSTNNWISKPADVEESDGKVISQKVKELEKQISAACQSDDYECHKKLLSKIKGYRAKALRSEGENSYGAKVYRQLQRSGEISKLTEHLRELKRLTFQMESTGQLPVRNWVPEVPLKRSNLTMEDLEQMEDFGKPTNVGLWQESLMAASRQLPFVHRTIQVSEAINQYYLSNGRWYSYGDGEPCYVNVDMDIIREMVGGDKSTSRRFTSNLMSSTLKRLANESHSISSYKTLAENSKIGNDRVVGEVLQETIQSTGRNHDWFIAIAESFYRGTGNMPRMMDRMYMIEDLLNTLRG